MTNTEREERVPLVRHWSYADRSVLEILIAKRPALTASEIAKTLNRSRSAVIGYCHREGIDLPISRGKNKRRRPRHGRSHRKVSK